MIETIAATIHRGTMDDMPLCAEFYEQGKELFKDAPELFNTPGLEHLRCALANGDVLIAEIDQSAVGFIMMSYLPVPEYAVIGMLYVTTRFRKAGVGSQLVKAGLALAKDRGYKKTLLLVHNRPSLIDFYVKHGHRQIGVVLEGDL